MTDHAYHAVCNSMLKPCRTNCIFTFNHGQEFADIDLPLFDGKDTVRMFLIACSQCLRKIPDNGAYTPSLAEPAEDDRLVKVSMCANLKDGEGPDWYDECNGKLYFGTP